MEGIRQRKAGSQPDVEEDLSNLQGNHAKPSCLDYLATRVQYLGLGAAASAICTPMYMSISFLAQKIGLLPELNQGTILYELMESLEFLNFERDALLIADCPMEELVSQLNKNFFYFKRTVFDYKVNVLSKNLQENIVSGLVFQGFLQDIVLKRIPTIILKTIAPGTEKALDSRVAAIARITIATLVHSYITYLNFENFSRSILLNQMTHSFVMGIGLGLLKESKLGLMGSLGAGVVTNLITLTPFLMRC